MEKGFTRFFFFHGIIDKFGILQLLQYNILFPTFENNWNIPLKHQIDGLKAEKKFQSAHNKIFGIMPGITLWEKKENDKEYINI